MSSPPPWSGMRSPDRRRFDRRYQLPLVGPRSWRSSTSRRRRRGPGQRVYDVVQFSAHARRCRAPVQGPLTIPSGAEDRSQAAAAGREVGPRSVTARRRRSSRRPGGGRGLCALEEPSTVRSSKPASSSAIFPCGQSRTPAASAAATPPPPRRPRPSGTRCGAGRGRSPRPGPGQHVDRDAELRDDRRSAARPPETTIGVRMPFPGSTDIGATSTTGTSSGAPSTALPSLPARPSLDRPTGFPAAARAPRFRGPSSRRPSCDTQHQFGVADRVGLGGPDTTSAGNSTSFGRHHGHRARPTRSRRSPSPAAPIPGTAIPDRRR